MSMYLKYEDTHRRRVQKFLPFGELSTKYSHGARGVHHVHQRSAGPACSLCTKIKILAKTILAIIQTEFSASRLILKFLVLRRLRLLPKGDKNREKFLDWWICRSDTFDSSLYYDNIKILLLSLPSKEFVSLAVWR